MAEMTRNFCLLTHKARIDVVLDESVDTGEPIIPSDQLESSGNTAVASERCIMVLAKHIHAQGFRNIDEALVQQQTIFAGPIRRRGIREMLVHDSICVIGSEDLGAMSGNNGGVHSDEVGKQSVNRRRG